jgi:hypothetical protein
VKRVGEEVKLCAHVSPVHFGVLTSGALPQRPEDFFKAYGNVSDSDLNVYVQESLVNANRQLQLMAAEATAFAATSEFREALAGLH